MWQDVVDCGGCFVVVFVVVVVLLEYVMLGDWDVFVCWYLDVLGEDDDGWMIVDVVGVLDGIVFYVFDYGCFVVYDEYQGLFE